MASIAPVDLLISAFIPCDIPHMEFSHIIVPMTNIFVLFMFFIIYERICIKYIQV